MPIEPGTKLGQYEVQEFIGEGAMGTVYRAYHAQLARTGAVKVMHALSPDKDSIARFRHEAQAIARMRHPNILNVFDFGEYEGMPYMIVEYVPGGNLAGRMGQGPLDRGTALRYLRGIAAGLDYAHSQGIVHRDVKPANVLLEQDETPVLADFGLAKMLQGSSLTSMTGVTTGTPAYMAPEQVTGHEVGPAADRYSLATIAYEMLTGSIPFQGQGVIELLYAHVHLDPALPSSLKPELNQSVDAVIMRGLAKEPRSRWGSCEAFVTALGAALGAKSVAPSIVRTVDMAPPVERIDGTLPFAAPPATVPSPIWPPIIAAARQKTRRRRYLIVAIAVLALLALVAGVVGFIFRDAFTPTLSVSSPTVPAGSILTVNATNLPQNQDGEIRLLSELFQFPFRTDSRGDLSEAIVIPLEIGLGDHHILLCWSSSCPLEVPLKVVAAGTLTTPSAGMSPTPSGSPRAGGRSPSPTPSTTQTPLPPANISISPTSGKAGSSVTVSGLYFRPGSTVIIYFIQQITGSNPRGTKAVLANGTFVRVITIPVAARSTQPAQIRACDSIGRCASQPFTVMAA